MKYSVEGFSQQKLVEFGMNTDDALLLRWFVDWSASRRMKIIEVEGIQYHWVLHKHISEQLPILGVQNAQSVSRRMKRLVDKGILAKHLVYEQDGRGGTWTYYAVSDKFQELVGGGQRTEESGGGGLSSPEGGGLSSPPKDSSIRLDSSSKEKGKANAPQQQKQSRSTEEHPTISVPINRTRYDTLCEQHGRRKVDEAIQAYSDWEATRGKKPARDYAAAAANWLRKESDFKNKTDSHPKVNAKEFFAQRARQEAV